MDTDELSEAIEGNDPDLLLRMIDHACEAGDWEGILTLRDRCYEAVSRGRQLWGVAHHAEYRLALEAPGPFAAPVVAEDPQGFALGPLPEVAAARHTWAELRDHLPEEPAKAVTAHERVVRGEDLTEERDIDRSVMEIPLVLASWEPKYPNADYHPDRAEFPPPDRPTLEPIALPEPGRPVEDLDAADALTALARTWTTQSNGRAEVRIVQGPAPAAISAFGLHEARFAPITPAEAFAAMGWAAASGGAYGKRPGTAAGRFAAWWAASALTGLLEEWPPKPERLGESVEGLHWFAWSDLVEPTGWDLHLAAHDPQRRRSWAITAVDAA
jgi:hypothetical protein